jgi:hypothetical protein
VSRSQPHFALLLSYEDAKAASFPHCGRPETRPLAQMGVSLASNVYLVAEDTTRNEEK